MQNNLLDYTGKIALIPGDDTGIGRATAIAFAEQGARVVIGDVSEEAADTIAELRRLACEALYVRTDVSDPASVEALVQTTVKHFGRLDCA